MVGVKVAPPFITKLEDGTLGGVTIGLWRTIARNLGISYRLRELRLPDLLAALEAGTVDVAASALTVTADRERRMDFSHPFFNTGFGIAIPNPVEQGTLTTVLDSLFSWAFLRDLATLALVLRHLIRNRFAGSVTILPGRFERQEYAFAYPAGSPLREPINRVLMEIRAGPQWNDILLDDLSADDNGWTE